MSKQMLVEAIGMCYTKDNKRKEVGQQFYIDSPEEFSVYGMGLPEKGKEVRTFNSRKEFMQFVGGNKEAGTVTLEPKAVEPNLDEITDLKLNDSDGPSSNDEVI